MQRGQEDQAREQADRHSVLGSPSVRGVCRPGLASRFLKDDFPVRAAWFAVVDGPVATQRPDWEVPFKGQGEDAESLLALPGKPDRRVRKGVSTSALT